MIVCKICGLTEESLRYSIQVFSNETKHIRVECPECRRFVQYAPRRPKYLRLAMKEEIAAKG